MKYKVIKAYWPTLKKHWVSWLIIFFMLLIGTSLQAVAPYYLREIVNTFTSGEADVALAKTLFLNLVVIVIVRQLIYRIFDLSLAIHESRAMKDLDNRTLQNIQRQSMNFFEDSYSGSLVTKARRFRSSYEGINDLFFFQFGQNILMFIVIIVTFTNTLPGLALPFTIWTIALLAYCISTTLWKYSYDIIAAEKDSRIGAALADTLTNHLAVKTFGQEIAEEKRFSFVVQDGHRARLGTWIRGNIITMGQMIIMGFGEMGFIWWMITGWEKGIVTAGDFVFAQTFIVWAMTHLGGFGQNVRKLFSAFAEAEEMARIYQLQPDVKDDPCARKLVIEDGKIEFKAASFRYGDEKDGAEHTVNDFTLTIPANKSIGLVGKSGAGKSTLIKLLLRFYNLDSGRILIDCQDIANVTQRSLRQQLAVVPQHPQLFHRSIRDNIAFATPGATDEEIIIAAQQAYAWEFIEKLPDGLDTMVGERGIKLSGGQQQRIAIARAILADPRILILDEATSALDSETEKLIQKAISNLLEGRTAIVIAHRLSTIMRLNQIVVMDTGRIIETGTHEELLESKGKYAKLWTHQSGGYIK